MILFLISVIGSGLLSIYLGMEYYKYEVANGWYNEMTLATPLPVSGCLKIIGIGIFVFGIAVYIVSRSGYVGEKK
jgi:hypothetical protein